MDCTPAFECQQTHTTTTNGEFNITICEGDNIADNVPLLNSLNIVPGDNYAYIITDENNLIEKVIFEDAYDFEGSGLGINRVYGVSFDANLNYTAGNALSSITADGCFILSDNTTFLTVTKVDCTPAFECQQTHTTTMNGEFNRTICEGDNIADNIPFLNSLNIAPGDNYAYIITDENNLITDVVFEGVYNFEGTGIGVNRVYGISFDANLNYTIGNALSTITADGCAMLSNPAAFLTVTKETCTANISGRITSQAGVGLEGFIVSLNDIVTTQTSADGSYEFREVPTNATYEIIPSENSDLLAGVTVFDLVLITRHILGIDVFDNPYQTIAADANNDNRVTTLDIVELNKVILGINEELPNNQSWRFVNSTETTSEALDAFEFSESIILTDLLSDATNINFLGVKVGDVSGGQTREFLNSESRSNAVLQFMATDVLVEAGQTIEIPISAENFDQILAYQFTMNLAGLDFIDIKGGVLEMTKSNFAQLDANTVTILWTKEQALSTNEPLFTIVAKSHSDIQLSEAVAFNATVTPAIAYEASGSSLDIDLGFQSIDNSSAIRTTQLLQNEPNPFTRQTAIGFNLANKGNINLTVFDATGTTMFTQTGTYDKGTHYINIPDAESFPSGIFYYQLSTAGYQETKKMIRM